jgi:low temperature requirement protein LtrA
MLFAVTLAALVMAAAIHGAFGDLGLVFALAYVAIQVGRTAYIVWELGPHSPLSLNYRRILGWLSISAVFWIAGAFANGWTRVTLWGIAVTCEYVSPMFGFRLPLIGRSRTSDWTIEGAHMAERCQLFVIVALGEMLLATGATLARSSDWGPTTLSALLATFLGTLAMWWLYFGTASKDATNSITRSSDPGRIGAHFHYSHVILVAGVIATAVGNDLVVAHPHDPVKLSYALVLCLGPAIYLLGSAAYKRVVYGVVPISHVVGIIAALLLLLVAPAFDLLVLGWLTTGLALPVAFWESRIGDRGSAVSGEPSHVD